MGNWDLKGFLTRDKVQRVHNRLVKTHQKFPAVEKKHQLELDKQRREGQEKLDSLLVEEMEKEIQYLRGLYK